MEIVTGAKRRRAEEDEEEHVDLISCLPDGVLGDIVSLLPTKDGARTQVISTRWRHLWRSAPLNLDLDFGSVCELIPVGKVPRVLSAHPGPGRRLSIAQGYFRLGDSPATTLDGWLRSPALDHLQELEVDCGTPLAWRSPSPMPASAHRFSSTLRVASFARCGFPDGDNAAGAIQVPVLTQLSLSYVTISENSLHALLAGCPILQSLLLYNNFGCSLVRIVSPSLRSIGVNPGYWKNKLEQLIIEDAPCVERLLLVGNQYRLDMVISVISAPKLDILGPVSDNAPRLEFGTTVLQGSHNVSLTTVVRSVKVLALTNQHLSLDVVVDFMKCFPCLEKLYIRTSGVGKNNVWYQKYRNIIGTLDIRLKKIALTNYRGNKSHVNFVKFFVLNARVLESMILQIEVRNMYSVWIERQYNLLQIKNRASRSAQFDFLSDHCRPGPFGFVGTEQAHDLSTADPFLRFRDRS